MKSINATYIAILLFLFGMICLYLGTSLSYAIEITDNNIIEEQEFEKTEIKENNPVKIKLSFIGDSLIGSFKGENVVGNFRDLLENNKYSFPYKNVSNIFKEDDYTIANGENVFTNGNLHEIEKNYDPAYWYFAPTKFANIYDVSSIEVVSVMNNHTYDYGYEGFLDTVNALEKSNIIVGKEEPVILEKDNIKIGLLCINLFSEYQYDECLANIKKIKNKVNYIIIYFHGGLEYLYKPTDEIVRYAHGFIDNGADLVIGAHPHVLEPIEVYKDKKIVYSLGSFLFGGTKYFVNRTIIYQMELEFDLNKNLVNEQDTIIPCYLYTGDSGYESWIPSVITNIEEKNRVLDFMNNLRETPL